MAHAARPVALERPAFLQKTGMTGAERGTAIHAFMQSVPFDGTAPDLDAEVQRQIDARLLDAGLADKLDLDRVRPFFESAVWRRIRHAKAVLREEPFITALPAAQITPEAGECEAEVLVQGIADLVLVYDDHAEILDYKTDRTLRARLRENMGGATMLIVAQRVSTILDADRILVMEDGQIVGNGTHKELLRTCELYREIAQLQLGEEEVAREIACV